MIGSVGHRFGDWLSIRRNFISFGTWTMGALSFVVLFVWLRLGYGIGGPIFWIVIALVSVLAGYVWALLMWHLVFAERIRRLGEDR